MNVRRLMMAGTIAAAAMATVAIAQQQQQAAAPTTAPAAANRSPSPDMPAEWFYGDGAYVTDQQRALIGKPAPALNVTKWFQGALTADDLKGKVVFIDFWATWCAPCKAAMPHTDELARTLKEKGVVVLAICSDGDEKLVPPFIADKKLTLPMAWDEGGAMFKTFGGDQDFPSYTLIDRKGNLRAITLKKDAVEKAIDQLLAEK